MVKVLFSASEAVPFVKTGTLADVVGSLPKYLDKEEYDVRIILPKYTCMDEHLKKMLHFISHFYITLGWRKQYVGILEAVYDNITYYFIDNEFYFSGETPYGYAYEDIEKFAFFSKAVLESLPVLGFQPDIIHCNDWETGLIPVYLKNFYDRSSFYYHMKTVFTIHNLKFAGKWKLKMIQDITGLPDEAFTADKLEFYEDASYLKGGIVYSDIITTLSKTYAYDITTVNGGEGLDGVLHNRKEDLYGILSGIDYERYNPQTDSHIIKRYSASDIRSGKSANKTALQKTLHIMENEEILMIGIVSRFTYEKGFDLILSVLDNLLMSNHMQFIVIGTGEEKYISSLNQFSQKYPQKLYFQPEYVEEFAHKIYAACDAFLMPSLFEPCGLSQLISMRYGTIPIVRKTGGLQDTIIDVNEQTNEKESTGFMFEEYESNELLRAIKFASSIYYENKVKWYEIAKNGMKMDYSWEKSAREYEKVYTKLLI